MSIVVQARGAVLRLAAHLLGKELRRLLGVAFLEVAVTFLEVVFASVVILHLLGIHRLVVLQRSLVVAAGIVEIAQVEARHLLSCTLRIESQELLQTVVGIVVVELLRAHTGIVAGVADGEPLAVGRSVERRHLVEYLLGSGILLLLVEVHGMAEEPRSPFIAGLALRPNCHR